MKQAGQTILASNRKARHDFTIIDVVEAGIVLVGSEVKSLRTGQVQLADAYARVMNHEVWLEGVHIAPYRFAVGVGAHDPAPDASLSYEKFGDDVVGLAGTVVFTLQGGRKISVEATGRWAQRYSQIANRALEYRAVRANDPRKTIMTHQLRAASILKKLLTMGIQDF